MEADRTVNRGNRLYPHWSNPSYYVLAELRENLINLIEKYVIPINTVQKQIVVVDLGCGNKPYWPLFKPYVERYIGVDLPENKLAELHFAPETDKVPLPDDVANVVLSTQVLEHIFDPQKYLSEAKRLLDLDGIMILSTHGYWQEHPDPNDYWRWTSEGLLKLIKDSGWNVLEFIGILGFASAALQLLQNALMPKVPNTLRKLFVVFMQLLIRFVDKFYVAKTKSHDACVFVLVAKPIEE